MIAQIAKAMFPELLERRLRETEAEKAKFELCLPAFFYNVPVFPGQTLCLHFFEPRYKLMMRRIIDTSRRYMTLLVPAKTRHRAHPIVFLFLLLVENLLDEYRACHHTPSEYTRGGCYRACRHTPSEYGICDRC